MSKNRELPEVNAGSMADIAFLLLIFFLVTTTIETDAGLNRMLPSGSDRADVKEKNLFRVSLNSNDELLVEDELIEIQDLREKAIAFLDNGGIAEGDGYCSYCKGERDAKSSDNPQKAILSLSNTRGTNYGVYVAVQNELVGAYNELRDREALRLYNILYTDLLTAYNTSELLNADKRVLKEQIETVRNLFPQKLSEAEITAN
ncbi:biopolymer transporter ExbD [uncultured Croceitalea sp.]|uniref:ExbD/TolR family protein n=1 Tax=uncultured Croceitalea sp. TaxID=1798908 RepID=UPI003305E12A